MTAFQGFQRGAIRFLIENQERNSKPWFESHRSMYDSLLLDPFRQLIREMTPAMMAIDPEFDMKPAISRTISRIYRDTRFTKEKSLFRDTMWLVIRRLGQDWKTSVPAFYFEIMPKGYRYGMGFYQASREVMDRFREGIDAKPQQFKKAVQFLEESDRFTLNGDLYKRRLPCEHAGGIQNWYQRKSFYLSCERDHDDILYSPRLVEDLIDGFEILGPLYRFIVTV
ncbi:DUF2461 domain-containing protein [bacterium]|nr:DUF2461 domain-containing protein [bacterium]